MIVKTRLYKFSEWLDNRSKHNTILYLLLAGLIFSIFIFQYLKKLYGLQDHLILDLSFGFTPAHANKILTDYGNYGRKGILVLTGIVDMLYPLIYGSLLALLISRFKVKNKSHRKTLQFINLWPFIAVLFDFIENTGILIMIKQYPGQNIPIAHTVSLAGIIKWFVIGVCILILLLLLLQRLRIIRKLKLME